MTSQNETDTITNTEVPAKDENRKPFSTIIEYSPETITPERAKSLLAHSVNKDLDKKAIARYAEAMGKGIWMENFQTIAITADGKVLDGIHRLHACIEAGVPFYTWVARNVREDTLHTIDQHRRRSFLGVLESRGVKHSGSVMHATTKLIRLANGVMGKSRDSIAWGRYDNVITLNPEIQEAAVLAREHDTCPISLVTRPVLVFMAIKAGYKEQVIKFLKAMQPDNIALEPNSPPAVLARQIAIARSNKSSYDFEVEFSLSILAFNDYVTGNPAPEFYTWTPDYGTAKLNAKGKPVRFSDLKEKAPANIGIPEMINFPGTNGAIYDTTSIGDSVDSKTDAQLLEATKKKVDEKQIRQYTITPEMAKKLLAFNKGNRKISESHVTTLSRDMEKGFWMENAQPICFTANPFTAPKDKVRLLNGQHRLQAVVKSKTAVDIPLAWGAPQEAFATFDTSAKRSISVGDTRADSRVVSAAAKMLWKEQNGFSLTGSGNTPSTTELNKIKTDNPGLYQAYPRSRHVNMRSIASAGVMTYAIYRIEKEHPIWGPDFIDGLENGDNLESKNPALKLRNKMLQKRSEMSRAETIAAILEGWEKYKKYRKAQEKNKKQGQLL